MENIKRQPGYYWINGDRIFHYSEFGTWTTCGVDDNHSIDEEFMKIIVPVQRNEIRIHEDERRILEDWPEAKIITAKQDCILGDHYHKIKTEKFILVHGNATVILTNDFSEWKIPMQKGVIYTVEPNIRHTFSLTAESVLIGLCSHPYDPTDDYR